MIGNVRNIYRRGTFFWIRYRVHGKEFRESSKSERQSDAEKLLKARLKQQGSGRFIGPKEEKVTMASLFAALEAAYKLNMRRSLSSLTGRLKPLGAFFDGRAIDVRGADVERYKTERLASKTSRGTPVAVATLNRELAALKRAFKLGIEQERISHRPTITLLEERNARQGFVTQGDFDKIVAHLLEPLDDIATFAYLSGWRKGEVLTLEWGDIDRSERVATLRREHSKSGEPRRLPLVGALGDLIDRRWSAREYTTPSGESALSEHVFHHRGQRIWDFRKRWKAACGEAGLPNILFHDLRRSCVRNLERAGVSQAVAMQVTGHKTDSVYRRYRIVSDDDRREALTKMQASLKEQPKSNVMSIRARKGAGK